MKELKVLGWLGILLAFCVSTPAALLPPGGLVGPLPVNPPGPLPLAVMVSPFNAGGALVGTLSSWVVAGDPSNPFGGLSFYYQVNNSGSEAVGRVTVSGFGVMVVDVAAVAGAWDGALPGGVAPLLADRSMSGNVIGFDYLVPQVPGGGWSELMAVYTPARQWGAGLGAVIDNRGANVDVLAPVPEPTTMIAGVLLLVPLALRALRRK